MTHEMRLYREPFEKIARGTKTIELRLNDPKRQMLQVGDRIRFVCREQPELAVAARIEALHPFADFAALYAALPLDQCGYTPEEAVTASPKDMEQYYTPEEQKRYGVLGIQLRLESSC